MYNDSLLQVADDRLVIKHYYFPIGGNIQIPYTDILKVAVVDCTLMNGRFRLWGMGLLPIWFAVDWKRPSRDKIFVVHTSNSWLGVGFTAESSADVVKALEVKKVPLEFS